MPITLTDPAATTLDDIQAPEDDGRTAVTVRLTARHHEYLIERAAQHGETPERHLETILRQFRSHHDTVRPIGGNSQPAKGRPA